MAEVKGFVASSFDLLHAGHIIMLEEARKNCDYLIVGLHTNPEHKKNLVQSSSVLEEAWHLIIYAVAKE